MKSLAMEIKENQKKFEKRLETQYAISRRKNLEIEDLRAKLTQQEGNRIIIVEILSSWHSKTLTLKSLYTISRG